MFGTVLKGVWHQGCMGVAMSLHLPSYGVWGVMYTLEFWGEADVKNGLLSNSSSHYLHITLSSYQANRVVRRWGGGVWESNICGTKYVVGVGVGGGHPSHPARGMGEHCMRRGLGSTKPTYPPAYRPAHPISQYPHISTHLLSTHPIKFDFST